MNAPLEARHESARRWLDYARRDLKNASRCLADEDLLGIAAFHAQQAAEKSPEGLRRLAGRRRDSQDA
jgi:HEPN domain-containing protein